MTEQSDAGSDPPPSYRWTGRLTVGVFVVTTVLTGILIHESGEPLLFSLPAGMLTGLLVSVPIFFFVGYMEWEHEWKQKTSADQRQEQVLTGNVHVPEEENAE